MVSSQDRVIVYTASDDRKELDRYSATQLEETPRRLSAMTTEEEPYYATPADEWITVAYEVSGVLSSNHSLMEIRVAVSDCGDPQGLYDIRSRNDENEFRRVVGRPSSKLSGLNENL